MVITKSDARPPELEDSSPTMDEPLSELLLPQAIAATANTNTKGSRNLSLLLFRPEGRLIVEFLVNGSSVVNQL